MSLQIMVERFKFMPMAVHLKVEEPLLITSITHSSRMKLPMMAEPLVVLAIFLIILQVVMRITYLLETNLEQPVRIILQIPMLLELEILNPILDTIMGQLHP